MSCDAFWPEDPLPIADVREDAPVQEVEAPISFRMVRLPKRAPVPVGRLRALNALMRDCAQQVCRCAGLRTCVRCKAHAIIRRWPLGKSPANKRPR